MTPVRTLAISLLVSTCIAGLAIAETTAPPSAPVAFVPPPPPGELVDIGGRRLHILCKGEGRTVIFEAGLSQYTAWSTYSKAQDLIAPFARVCTYDRAGLGWSDAAPRGRTHQDMVEDLHRLTRAAKLKGPYILVGHSMGGLLVRLYETTYPKDVAGLVLLDSSTEGNNLTPEAAVSRKEVIGQIDGALKNAKPHQPVAPFPAGTPADVLLAYTPDILATVKDEYLALDLVPEARHGEHGYGTLGDKPLVIVARGRMSEPPSESDKSWRATQEGLKSLSSNSSFMVAEKSGHVIPYDEPEVAAAAVKQVLDAVSTRGRLASP